MEGLGENVPEDGGSMSVGLMGERRRRVCGVNRAAPLLLEMVTAEEITGRRKRDEIANVP